MIVISFCNSLGQSFCEDVCNTNTTRILSSRNVVSNHQAYIDTIIRNTSLAMTIAEGDSDDEEESEMESEPDTIVVMMLTGKVLKVAVMVLMLMKAYSQKLGYWKSPTTRTL